MDDMDETCMNHVDAYAGSQQTISACELCLLIHLHVHVDVYQLLSPLGIQTSISNPAKLMQRLILELKT